MPDVPLTFHGAEIVPDVDPEKIRLEERDRIWRLIDAKIKKGHLPGNGCDPTAENNGLILAANLIATEGRMNTQPIPAWATGGEKKSFKVPPAPPVHAPDDLKEKINEFLWVTLPAHTTLGRAEAIALDLVEKIMAEYGRSVEEPF